MRSHSSVLAANSPLDTWTRQIATGWGEQAGFLRSDKAGFRSPSSGGSGSRRSRTAEDRAGFPELLAVREQCLLLCEC
jgi:hypothetical protein